MAKTNDDFRQLMEEMSLTPGLTALLLDTGRSTMHGWLNDTTTTPALAVQAMRTLRYIWEMDKDMFMNFLVLCEMKSVENGTKRPELARDYRQGKLRKPLREYIEMHSGIAKKSYSAARDKINLIHKT